MKSKMVLIMALVCTIIAGLSLRLAWYAWDNTTFDAFGVMVGAGKHPIDPDLPIVEIYLLPLTLLMISDLTFLVMGKPGWVYANCVIGFLLAGWVGLALNAEFSHATSLQPLVGPSVLIASLLANLGCKIVSIFLETETVIEKMRRNYL